MPIRDAGAIAGQGGPMGMKGYERPYSANIYYPLSQTCTAYTTRYWLCIDKGVKRLGEFLSILKTVPSVAFSGWNTVVNIE